LDQRVWEVLAKIQARKARELLDRQDSSAEALAQCFSLKLTADGHDFELAHASANGVEFMIRACPWEELLRKSDRRISRPSGRDDLQYGRARVVCGVRRAL